MSDVETLEDLPPVAHAVISYLGPVAPHWEIRTKFGDEKLIDDFRARVDARLLLLPKHDPQFRRNRERVNRDAERELIRLDWDLGDEEPTRSQTPVTRATPAAVEVAEPEVAEAEPVVAEAEVAEPVAAEAEVAEPEAAEPESEVTEPEVAESAEPDAEE